MWVFDGEKWNEEGTSPRPEPTQKPLDPRDCEEFYPELQVIEVPRVEREYVPFPVLIP
jgi:hypothetical protein